MLFEHWILYVVYGALKMRCKYRNILKGKYLLIESVLLIFNEQRIMFNVRVVVPPSTLRLCVYVVSQ